jgi:signal transduction histidine kinase/ligand-binding sensor domain-containing protein
MTALPLFLLGLLIAPAALAGTPKPDPTLRQLNHRVFTRTEGVPSDIDALAQTSDGTLWIGGRAGLVRFDGVRFVSYPEPGEEPLRSSNVSALFAAPDGALWIGFRPHGVAVLRDGRLTHYSYREGLPDGAVQQFASDRDGSLWVGARLGLARFKDDRWQKVMDESKLEVVYGVLADRVGTLWVAAEHQLLARAAGESHFSEVDARGYEYLTGLRLAAGPDDSVWAASRELMRIQRRGDRYVVSTVRGMTGGPLLFDRQGNLWTADEQADTLLRVPARALASLTVEAEKFSSADGLNSGRVSALLEDREGNIWIGTNIGLHRFTRSDVVRDAAPPCFRGVLSPAAVVAGNDGSLWIACDQGSQTRVDEIRDGALVGRHFTPAFNVAHRDEQGTVWFAGPMALGQVENGRIVTTPVPAQVLGRPAQAMVRDREGAMWISYTRRGLYRVLDGKWSEYGGLEQLPRTFPYVQTADSNGNLWFGYTENRIARVNGDTVQRFDSSHGLAVGNVLAIAANDANIWVGGELGFARLQGTRFLSIHCVTGTPFKGISGIVKARNGDLWLNGVAGIVHITRQEIERVVEDPAHRVGCETFDYLDGVPGTAVQLRPQPSAIETTDGRLWFSTTGGIVSIDASRRLRNTLAPPVTIWSLTSGSKRYAHRGAELSLPVHTTDLQIEYSAGSLTVPERVRFRYKLEGLDRQWQEVGTRREALYTNLQPGQYTFWVTAANNDGVWNDTGASMRFVILPTFYQTRWFAALVVLAGVALLYALYRMRVRHVAAQVRGRLEARLAERERIARDLHDTLLQGVQGLIWHFQAATNRIPSGEPARQLLEESLDRADKLLEEGRDKVKDLRPSAVDVVDLPQALAAECEQFSQGHVTKSRVSVQGTRRELHPIVREEGFLIAREALSNAFRHSRAANIEAEVSYSDAALHVRVRDDGMGISHVVLDAGGTPGHFGLVGMRERAKKLGAQLQVWSRPGAGTEVDLCVPGKVAYRTVATASGAGFLLKHR